MSFMLGALAFFSAAKIETCDGRGCKGKGHEII